MNRDTAINLFLAATLLAGALTYWSSAKTWCDRTCMKDARKALPMWTYVGAVCLCTDTEGRVWRPR